MAPLTLAASIEEILPLAAIAAGTVIVLVWIIMATIDSTVKTRAREETRRELAAYVAEGSMTAADAAQIMNAGKNPRQARATPTEFSPLPGRA